MFPTFAGSRIAPSRFHNAPTLRSMELWRGLVWAVVPMTADATGSAIAWTKCGRELVKNRSNDFAGGVVLRGEASGPALWSVGAGLAFQDSPLPTAAPFSCFAFLVRRDAQASIQSLINCSGSTNGGWTFQLNYGSGQLGMTRWGQGDHPTTVLGAVPNAGAVSVVGLTHDGTTARFFMNGRFENVSAGAIQAPSGGTTHYNLFHRAGGSTAVNCSAHVAYVWNRIVLDDEFLRLMQDPWAIVRPPELSFALTAAGGGGGSGARSFVAGLIG